MHPSTQWLLSMMVFFFFSSRRRHTRLQGDWSSDVCSSDLGKTEFSSDDALQIAYLKTGSLFAFCGEAGALAARAPEEVTAALRDFGMRAGTTFQIADDLLDFESDAATLGKAVLADVTEGKPSLPLAIALKRLPPLREEMAALLKPEPEATEDEVRARVRVFAARLSRTGALGAPRGTPEEARD